RWSGNRRSCAGSRENRRPARRPEPPARERRRRRARGRMRSGGESSRGPPASLAAPALRHKSEEMVTAPDHRHPFPRLPILAATTLLTGGWQEGGARIALAM